MRREMRLQFGKDPMLERLFFGCRFDDQIHRAEARELRLRGDPGERRVARLLVILPRETWRSCSPAITPDAALSTVCDTSWR